MALVMEDNDICTNWEDIEENSDILDKQLARLKLEKSKREEAEGLLVKNNNVGTGNGTESMLKSNSIVLDTTTQESLRTQYAPPEPKMTILMRPKEPNNTHNRKGHREVKNVPSKSLQQREQEYAEARMRILGDVRFEAEEAEVAEAQQQAQATLSPAEILKLKIAEAIRADNNLSSPKGPQTTSSSNFVPPPAAGSGVDNNNIQNQQQPGGHHTAGPHNAPSGRGGRNKRSREKNKIKPTLNPEAGIQRDFPVHKTDSEFIFRHPRGPDGTSGFNLKRT